MPGSTVRDNAARFMIWSYATGGPRTARDSLTTADDKSLHGRKGRKRNSAPVFITEAGQAGDDRVISSRNRICVQMIVIAKKKGARGVNEDG